MGITTITDEVKKVLREVHQLRYIYDHEPLLIAPDNLPAAVIFVDAVEEYRKGLGGVGAKGKRADYNVEIDVHDHTREPDIGQRRFYELIDAIKTELRKNQTLGDTVQRFGEDISVTIQRPRGDGTTTIYEATITSKALEEMVG